MWCHGDGQPPGTGAEVDQGRVDGEAQLEQHVDVVQRLDARLHVVEGDVVGVEVLVTGAGPLVQQSRWSRRRHPPPRVGAPPVATSRRRSAAVTRSSGWLVA